MTPHRASPWLLLFASALLATAALVNADAAPAKAAKAVPAFEPVEGFDYQRIDHPAPLRGAKVSVVEVFGYGCPVCNAFQPYLTKWQKTLPSHAQFSYLPAAFGDGGEHCWNEFTRAFYAAQALHVQARSHDAIYKEVFEQHRIEPGCQAIPSLYTDFGISEKAFAARMTAPDIEPRVTAAHSQAVAWGIEGTPTLVVDGTYRVGLAKGPAQMLQTVDWLIAKQHRLHKGH